MTARWYLVKRPPGPQGSIIRRGGGTAGWRRPSPGHRLSRGGSPGRGPASASDRLQLFSVSGATALSCRYDCKTGPGRPGRIGNSPRSARVSPGGDVMTRPCGAAPAPKGAVLEYGAALPPFDAVVRQVMPAAHPDGWLRPPSG